MISECYAEYSLTMNGSPFHAETEYIVTRLVHKKTNKIHEIVVHQPIDGATINQHTVETLTGESGEYDDKGLGMKLKDFCALALDRVSTNKMSKDILNEDYGVQPFAAYCISRGLSTCGKKGK